MSAPSTYSRGLYRSQENGYLIGYCGKHHRNFSSEGRMGVGHLTLSYGCVGAVLGAACSIADRYVVYKNSDVVFRNLTRKQ